jgi:hypothetical protein
MSSSRKAPRFGRILQERHAELFCGLRKTTRLISKWSLFDRLLANSSLTQDDSRRRKRRKEPVGKGFILWLLSVPVSMVSMVSMLFC